MIHHTKTTPRVFLPILIILIMFMAVACKDCLTEPTYTIGLSVEDIACVWASLAVTLPDSGGINTFALERNDSTVGVFTCEDNDTLIIDEGLLPDTDYSYSVRYIKKGEDRGESDIVSIHTLPTTSHDFRWEVDTLGIYGGFLNDAFIVNENNIWVVGNIETDSCEYNAAHWNGEAWEYLGIYSNTLDLYSIHYFNENDIWVTSAGLPYHWNGQDWTQYHIQNMGIDASVGLECWGTSSSNMYFVGLDGAVVHYDGTTFTKLETVTDVRMLDVDGTANGDHIFVSGNTNLLPAKSAALEITNNNVDLFYYIDGLYQEGTYGYVGGVSVFDHYVYFSTPAGIWQYDFKNEHSTIMDVDEVECRELYVNSYNDIIGYRGGMGFIHYNGEDWRLERYLENYYNLSCNSGDYKDDIAVMVGFTHSWQAIVARGHHN